LTLDGLNSVLIEFAYEIDSLGGNPICNKIENTILSSICRLNRIDEPQLGMIPITFTLYMSCKLIEIKIKILVKQII